MLFFLESVGVRFLSLFDSELDSDSGMPLMVLEIYYMQQIITPLE